MLQIPMEKLGGDFNMECSVLLMHVAQLGRQHDGFFVVPRGPLGSVLNELVFVRLLQLEPRKHHLQALTI